MPSKTELQTFQTNWNKTIQWAKSNGISQAAYMPVYNMDVQKFYSGGQLSEAERTRAIAAAAGLNYSTPTPGDSPSPYNLPVNIQHNLSQIFTGLEPIGLAKNLWDTVTNAVEHPMSQIVRPTLDLTLYQAAPELALDKKISPLNDFSNTVLAPHSLYGLVPGAYDLAEVSRGTAGAKALAQNPVTALIDVLPFMKATGFAISKTALGAQLAEKIGISTEELGKLTPAQMSWRILQNKTALKVGPLNIAPTSGIRKNPLTNDTELRPLTFRERQQAFFNSKNLGSQQAEIIKDISVEATEATRKVIETAGPAVEALNRLAKSSIQSYDKVIQTIYNDHRSDTEIVNDPQFSSAESDALNKVFDWTHWNEQIKLQTEGLMAVQGPFGPELYTTRPGSSGYKVQAAMDEMKKAKETLDAASTKFDEMLFDTQDISADLKSTIDAASTLRQSLYANIQASIPDIERSDVTDVLRSSLPADQRFNRQTYKPENLEKLFGLDERTVPMVRRGAAMAEPFTGKFVEWSDSERQAWHDAERTLGGEYERSPLQRQTEEKTHFSKVTYKDRTTRAGASGEIQTRITNLKNIPRSQIKSNALAHLQAFGQLTTQRLHATVPLRAARNLKEIVGPGGIMDKATRAYTDGDWETLRSAAELMSRRLSNKSFQSPTRSAQLDQLVHQVDTMVNFSRVRANLENQMNRLWKGVNKHGTPIQTGPGAHRYSIESLTAKSQRAAEKALYVATMHPPDVWHDVRMDVLTDLVTKSENGARTLDDYINKMGAERGYADSELEKLRSDPRLVMEMVYIASKATNSNRMLPDIDYAEEKALDEAAYKSIAAMRAKGGKPRYIPTVTPQDVLSGQGAQPFNVTIGAARVPSISSSFEKTFSHTSSIYNVELALLKDTKEIYRQEHTLNIIDQVQEKFAYDRSVIEPMWAEYDKANILAQSARGAGGGAPAMTGIATFDKWLEDNNLVPYEPDKLFPTGAPRFLGRTQYIDKDILKGITESITKFQSSLADNAIASIFDKTTDIFRSSILGYSPRFTFHIIFGGGALLGLRLDPRSFAFIKEAYHVAKTGTLSPETLSKFRLPAMDATEFLTRRSTEEGLETQVWHFATGYSMHQFVIQEKIANLFGITPEHPDWMSRYLKVVPNINFKFTRFVTQMQQALAFFDGVAGANRKGYFWTDTLDDAGKVVRTKQTMSPEMARDIGMRNVMKVQGDLRAMTPLERNVIVRVFPFWGWTKHILQYVMTYPIDHPYRTFILAQLAEQNSEAVAPGLPMRIQLLAFLGSPDAQGNVKTEDLRFMNPFRDVANYATLSGWLAAVNPVISAPFSAVDPQLSFGNNVMYPNITYNSLYGTEQASASGGPLNALESVVPQVNALDQAFNLSGQYSYLQQSGQSGAFWHKLTESLNIPFLYQQSINLRQIAATGEIDRYKQAEAAANSAWTTGDFSSLDGYTSVPDPRNTQYNITPADLYAVYAQTLATSGGLPPSQVAQPLPNPAY